MEKKIEEMSDLLKSEADAEAYKTLTQKFQRDLNCLSDPDRNVRRWSLIQLTKTVSLETCTTYNRDLLRVYYLSHLIQPLLGCFQDPVEKCREMAINLMLSFFRFSQQHMEEETAPVQSMMDTIALNSIDQIHERLGASVAFHETAEELRLMLLELFQLTLLTIRQHQTNATGLSSHAQELIIAIISKSAADPYPDAKKKCNDCCIQLAKDFPEVVRLSILAKIAKPIASNLAHQHSKIRNSTLKVSFLSFTAGRLAMMDFFALSAIVPCGMEGLSEVMVEILPMVKKIVFDRSASVRKEFCLTILNWLKNIQNITIQLEGQLFPLLLIGLTDPTTEVQEYTESLFSDIGAVYEKRFIDLKMNDEVNESIFEFSDLKHDSSPPPPLKQRPHIGVRLKAKQLLPEILPNLLEETSEWTVDRRVKATGVLKIFIILVENGINLHLEEVLKTLAKTCRDDEPVVAQEVAYCVNAIGHYASPDMLFNALLPLVMGSLPGQDTVPHRTNGLVLLATSIEGMQKETIQPHLEQITNSLCDCALRETEAPELQDVLATVASKLLESSDVAICSNDSFSFRLFWILNQLLSTAKEGSPVYDCAFLALKNLAHGRRCENIEGIYCTFLPELFVRMDLSIFKVESEATDDRKCSISWTKNHPTRLLFDLVCRMGGKACGESISAIVPVFLVHLSAKNEPDVRLTFLALLESMLGAPSISKAFIPYCGQILLKAIMPNIVWQGGRVAATVRKVGMACTYTLLRQKLANQECLFQTAPQMLPVLKSCLDDGDAKTRQLVCLSLQYLFVALPGALGEEPVVNLYPEILKRLDDSNDLVRLAACQTFQFFLLAAPPQHFQGTIIDYSLDCFFIHLDDPNKEIQEAVFGTLKETLKINKELLLKKAQEKRSQHRSPYYCDELIKVASSA